MPDSHNASVNSTEPCKPPSLSEVVEHEASYTFRVIALAVIMIISLVGNTLVCCGAMQRRRKPFIYYLVFNLSVAELVDTCLSPFLFHYESSPWSWVFGDFLCVIIDPLGLCVGLVVTFTLAAIAAYRCLMLLQPYRSRPTGKTALLVMACSWVWGIVLAMPAAVTRKLQIEPDTCDIVMLRCNEIFASDKARNDYSMVVFALQFVAPFVVMVVSYSIVIVKVKKHIHMSRNGDDAMEMSESRTRTSIASNVENKDNNAVPATKRPTFNGPVGKKVCREQSRLASLETDLLRMVYAIILIFFICYLPSHILFLSAEMSLFNLDEWPYNYILHQYMNLLHNLPSALHPICYGFMSTIIAESYRCCF